MKKKTKATKATKAMKMKARRITTQVVKARKSNMRGFRAKAGVTEKGDDGEKYSTTTVTLIGVAAAAGAAVLTYAGMGGFSGGGKPSK